MAVGHQRGGFSEWHVDAVRLRRLGLAQVVSWLHVIDGLVMIVLFSCTWPQGSRLLASKSARRTISQYQQHVHHSSCSASSQQHQIKNPHRLHDNTYKPPPFFSDLSAIQRRRTDEKKISSHQPEVVQYWRHGATRAGFQRLSVLVKKLPFLRRALMDQDPQLGSTPAKEVALGMNSIYT